MFADLSAQDHSIGHTVIQFLDTTRNKEIETQIYYPADALGENVAVAGGDFPVISFGHGFLMSWESYETYWRELVPLGYVLCFPTTEMSLAPDHESFGEDLKFVITQMKKEGSDSSSMFFNAIADRSALMGHSMGGGAAVLAAEKDSSITTLVNFAAAETNPSAISAAANVTIPTLMFSGDNDCVTPADEHQIPIYNNIISDCKSLVSIIDGGHCYFADDNFTCSLGESLCNAMLSITRDEQLSVTMDHVKPWLEFALYDVDTAFTAFKDSLQKSTRTDFMMLCGTVGIEENSAADELILFPNPVVNNLDIKMPKGAGDYKLSLYNVVGDLVHEDFVLGNEHTLEMTGIPSGSYFLIISSGRVRYSELVVKID